MVQEALAQILRYQDDPVAFVEEIFHVEPDGWQKEALRAIVEDDRVSIRSGHGVGKTAFLAWIIIWWMLLKTEPRIACTAPTAHQLSDVLWGEIAKWSKLLPEALKAELDVKADRVEATRERLEYYCVARTARKEQPEAFQGFHAPDMLFIVDEASGVDDIIFEVGEGAMSTVGAKTLMVGNPTRTSGHFYDSFHRMRGHWRCMRVSCEDAKMVDSGFIQRMADKYGRDSNIFRVRVLGEFPSQEDDVVISLALCEDAVRRDVSPVDGKVIWGLDVARFGDDSSALAKRQRNTLLEKVKEWKGKDIMQTVGIVLNEYNKTPVTLRPDVIMVDSIGLGAGAADRMREVGLPVRCVAVSERPSVQDHYMRLRDELWWKCREWLEDRSCKIPDDQDLIGELTTPKYEYTSAGKILVESKTDLKTRGVASPNRADALILTFASSDLKSAFAPLKYPKLGIV